MPAAVEACAWRAALALNRIVFATTATPSTTRATITNPAKPPAELARRGVARCELAVTSCGSVAGPVLTHSRQSIASDSARTTMPALRRAYRARADGAPRSAASSRNSSCRSPRMASRIGSHGNASNRRARAHRGGCTSASATSVTSTLRECPRALATAASGFRVRFSGHELRSRSRGRTAVSDPRAAPSANRRAT